MRRNAHCSLQPCQIQNPGKRVSTSKQHIHRCNSGSKVRNSPLPAKQRRASTLVKKQRQYLEEYVPSIQKLQEELGELLLSLLRSSSDDERKQYLCFIESTLRRYLQLIECPRIPEGADVRCVHSYPCKAVEHSRGGL